MEVRKDVLGKVSTNRLSKGILTVKALMRPLVGEMEGKWITGGGKGNCPYYPPLGSAPDHIVAAVQVFLSNVMDVYSGHAWALTHSGRIK